MLLPRVGLRRPGLDSFASASAKSDSTRTTQLQTLIVHPLLSVILEAMVIFHLQKSCESYINRYMVEIHCSSRLPVRKSASRLRKRLLLIHRSTALPTISSWCKLISALDSRLQIMSKYCRCHARSRNVNGPS